MGGIFKIGGSPFIEVVIRAGLIQISQAGNTKKKIFFLKKGTQKTHQDNKQFSLFLFLSMI